MAETDNLYLELLRKCLTRYIFHDGYRLVEPRGSVVRPLYAPIKRALAHRGLRIVAEQQFDPAARIEGRDWPLDAETMIGLRRLENLQNCVEDVLVNGIPGDLLEAGVWRGGATIFMRAMLKVYRDTKRKVWVADSFNGLPRPDSKRYPMDKGDRYSTFTNLSVSLEDVKKNFSRYGLLDDQVVFLAGWFRDTLPTAPIELLSVLRLDGDMYQSTMDTLSSLYHKVSVGGYIIIDDYGAVPGCRAAVTDFRESQNVKEELRPIDWTGVYWQKDCS